MIFRNVPEFDFAKQGRNAIGMLFHNALTLHGLKAQIFSPVTYENDYQPYAPEFTPDPVPSGTCLVLLGQPFEGLELGEFISLSDKVETQIKVTTDARLNINDQLRISFPDGKTMNLRIIENWDYHAQSSIMYRYRARVL